MTGFSDKRIWYSIIGIVIAALIITKAIDGAGTQNTEDALVRALATFGIARALNGVISVAQGTEIAIEPAGVGVIFTPGQILDPVNDLIERFSWVMLVSSASLGVLDVLLTMSVWQWFNMILLAMLTITLILIWFKEMEGKLIQRLMLRLTFILIILRFAAPVIAVGNEFIYQQFLEPRYQTAITELEKTTGRIKVINEQIRQQERARSSQEISILDKARELYQSAMQSIDVKIQINNYERAASNASRHVIDLIVIFIFQTILLPVAFLWLTWQLIKSATRYQNKMPDNKSEKTAEV